MNEIDAKIINTLKHIKTNPGCKSNKDNLDGYLLKGLIDKGWLEGYDATTIDASGPVYIELRLTIDGERYLADAEVPENKEPEPEPEPEPKPDKTKAPHWALPVILAAVLSIFVWGMVHFFGWK